MFENVKLIASDLDGTLLLNGTQKLQANTCDLIEEIINRGIKFVACSGRRYENLQRLFAPVKDKIDYVCDNGCIAYVGGKVVYRATMPKDLGRELIREIRRTKTEDVFVACEKNCYIQADRPEFIKYMREVVDFDVTPVEDIFDLPEEYTKISYFEEKGLTETDSLKKIFGDKLTMQTGGAAWFDTIPKNVNKRTAFEKISEHLNVKPENCIMFGDNDNDREILNYVGLPIVVESAKESIRRLGKMTTDTVENKLEEILKEI